MSGSAVGLGVVGCGVAALDVGRAVQHLPGVRLAAAFDVDAERAQRFGRAFDARLHASLPQLLDDDAVEAVYVALPHHLLADAVAEVIASGRPVLAEKPLAISAVKARSLGEAARTAGVPLGVFFELRDAAPVRWVRAALADGLIGRLRAIRISTLIDKPDCYWTSAWRARPEQAGGGVVMMNSTHQLDVVRFVTGAEVTRVSAEVAAFTPGVEVEDTAAATMRLDSGAILSLTAGSRSAGAEQEERITFEGDEGRLDLPYLLGAQPPRVYLRRPAAGMAGGDWTAVPQPKRDCYAETVSRFAEAARGGGPPTAEAGDAVRVLQIVEAVYEAARLGRAVPISP